MKSKEIKILFEQFETASFEYDGLEYWSARDLQVLLDYSQWRNFSNAKCIVLYESYFSNGV